MKSWYQNPVPTLVTLLLHMAILYLVIVGWQLAEPEKQLKVAPSYVKAKLVTMAEVKPKAAPKPKQVPKPAVKPKPEPKPISKPVPEPVKKPVAKPLPKPLPKPPPKPKVDQKALDAERAKKLAEQQARDRAESQQQAETDDEVAASYIGIIQQQLVLNWSRPPGTRNGMQVVLAIRLIPTGEVVDVKVVTSSGSVAFDQSAVKAVQRAERFAELANMPGSLFERHFRQLKLVFRPEDMKL